MGKIIGEGITFDDVLLVPAYSEVIPNQVDLVIHIRAWMERFSLPFTQVMTQMHRKPLLKRSGEKIKSSRRQSKEKKGLLCGTAVLPQTGLRQVIRR